ncbi:MAG: M56 family metallopeptidase [bacterium]
MNSWRETAGLVLLHSFWTGALVAAALSFALSFLRGANARYGVTVVALCVFALVPLFWMRPQAAAGVAWVASSNAGALSTEPLPAPSWLGVLPWAWAPGAALFAVRALGGWAVILRLRRNAVAVTDPQLLEVVRRWSAALGVTRQVHVFMAAVESPVTMGWWRPDVLLPLSALTGLGRPALEAVLAHELAHIARHDYLLNWLQVWFEIVYFYHPAAWWISSVLRREREHCCDDVAVQLSGDRARYARALLQLAELLSCRPPALAARQGEIETRIRRILQMNQPTTAPVWALPLLLLAVSLVSAQPPSANTCTSLPRHQTWLRTQVQWIIEDRERAAFGRLKEPAECERFVEQFWQRRGAGAKAEHERRMQWAAKRYPTLEAPQRLYVQLGPPDEIESHPKEGYEAWRYRSLPGKEKNYTVRFDLKSR